MAERSGEKEPKMNEYRVVSLKNGLGKVRYRLQVNYPGHWWAGWLDAGPRRRTIEKAMRDMQIAQYQDAANDWRVL